MLQHVGAEGRIHLLPAAQVSRSFVEQVAVARGQEVLHQDHRRADGNQQEELTRPALVVVLRVLQGGGGQEECDKVFGQPHLTKPSKHKAPRQVERGLFTQPFSLPPKEAPTFV